MWRRLSISVTAVVFLLLAAVANADTPPPVPQDQLRTLVAEAQTYGDQLAPGTFAGAWIDAASNSVVAAFVGDLEVHRQALTSRLPRASSSIKIISAQNTLATLNALSDRLIRDIPLLRGEGLQVSSIGVDIMTNRVHLSISNLLTDAIKARLANYGGEDVLTLRGSIQVELAVSRRATAAPFLGRDGGGG